MVSSAWKTRLGFGVPLWFLLHGKLGFGVNGFKVWLQSLGSRVGFNGSVAEVELLTNSGRRSCGHIT